MTGIAWLWQAGVAFFADEYDFMTAGDHIEDTCFQWGPALVVLYETYTIIPGAPTKDAHHAIEMIGVVKRYATKHGCRLLTAQPEQRKKATKAMLEAIGIWPTGKDDAQSATQHLVAWCLRTQNMPAHWLAALSEVNYFG
jgi:hypothetical protein